MNEFARPNLAVDQLPPANSADKDKVLTIDANGVPVWAENSGGGSSGGVLVVHDVDGTLDKTWQEIHDAALEQAVILPDDYEDTLEVYYLQTASSGHGIYSVDFAHNSNGSVDWRHFSASSASDYPVYYE